MKIIIAAGGTGGHVFPGIALAEEFRERNDRNQVLFIGTKRDLERKIIVSHGFRMEAIDASGLKRNNPLTLLTGIANTIRGTIQSMKIIKRVSPDLVIGFGGYVSLPVVLAASVMRIKTVIHEQNTIPGLANRVLGKVAHRVFISFRQSAPCFPRGKTILVGNPTRKIHRAAAEQSPVQEPFTLLIIGGSLGSHQINQACMDSLSDLLPIKDSIRIIHQTGHADLSTVRATYLERGFSAEVVPFIDQMDRVYRRAHLVVSRAGATTLAEIMIHEKAAVLIPYPFATGHHQHHNARVLVGQQAARMIDPKELTGRCLARHILDLYHNPERRHALEEKAGKLAQPAAAGEMVDHCRKLAASLDRECIKA